MVELNHNLLLDIEISSSHFLPYLIEENSEQFTKVFIETKEIKYKADFLKKNLHNKGFNEATYQNNSIFLTNPEILLGKYSIARPFLNSYFNFMRKVLNKRIQDLFLEEQTDAFMFLSLYNINFETLYTTRGVNMVT
jgi:hypothetical protein